MRLLVPSWIALTATLAGFAAAGCDRHPVYQRPAVLFGDPAPLTASDYPAVVQTWTRTDKIYQGFDNKLFVTATYHSPELRRAFALAFPEIYGHGGDVTHRELSKPDDQVLSSHNFFVLAYTPDLDWNDFDQRDSIWRITLVTDAGQVIRPSRVIEVELDENLRAVYPHADKFDEAYIVRFPRILQTTGGEATKADGKGATDHAAVIRPDTKRFKLRFASALGVAELGWQLHSQHRSNAADGAATQAQLVPND